LTNHHLNYLHYFHLFNNIPLLAIHAPYQKVNEFSIVLKILNIVAPFVYHMCYYFDGRLTETCHRLFTGPFFCQFYNAADGVDKPVKNVFTANGIIFFSN
jgi:hypothetical protein